MELKPRRIQELKNYHAAYWLRDSDLPQQALMVIRRSRLIKVTTY